MGVPEVVESVSSDTPEPAIDAGLKVAVAPVGNPDTFKLTMSVKPFTEFRYTFE